MENQIEADLSFYSCQNNSFIMQSQYNVMSSPRVSERGLSPNVSLENLIASDVLWPPYCELSDLEEAKQQDGKRTPC